MEKIEIQILIEILAESVKTNAMIDALVSMKLDQIEKKKLNEMASNLRQERILKLLEQYGEFLSDDDSEFLKSVFG